MMPAPELTPDQKAQVIELRKSGHFGRMDPRRIARIMKISEDRIRKSLGLRRKNRTSYTSTKGNTITNKVPPPHVVADRDHRLSLEHHSLSAAFFGDPPPGYSALDRRNGKH